MEAEAHVESEGEAKPVKAKKTTAEKVAERRARKQPRIDAKKAMRQKAKEEAKLQDQEAVMAAKVAEHAKVVSHRDARKRRKLEKALAAAGLDPNNLPTPSPATTKNKAERPASSRQETIFTTNRRSPHGVWIGNLHFATTAQQLVHFLDGCGTVTRCHLPSGRNPGEANRGFAYVDFDAREGAEAAVARSEGHLDGRKLLIKLATDYTGRPTEGKSDAVSKSARKILDRQKEPAGPCLFMGNLAFSTTEESIREMFEGHHRAASAWKRKPADGAVEDEETDELGIRKIRMGTFEDSGKCKGWAFVDFTSPQQATKALTDQRNHSLDGRDLKLEYASADAIRRGGGKLPPGSVTRTKGQKRPREEVEEEEEEAGGGLVQTALEVAESVERPPREKKAKKEGGKKDEKRQSSGATLASAPRAKTGIVAGASSGKKVVFA